MANVERLRGLLTAILTPFDAQGNLALEHFPALLDFQRKAGVDGVIVCGTNGEGTSLSTSERKQALETVLARGEGLTVIAGTGATSITDAVELTRHAADAGADAVLVLPPFFFKNPDARGVADYFLQVMDAADIPVLLYNIPQHSAVPITDAVLERLIKQPNLAGIKDSAGVWEDTLHYITAYPQLRIFAGSDRLAYQSFRHGGGRHFGRRERFSRSPRGSARRLQTGRSGGRSRANPPQRTARHHHALPVHLHKQKHSGASWLAPARRPPAARAVDGRTRIRVDFGVEGCRVPDMNAPERIIIRGVKWLGDAVMTMPAICRLREAFPDAHIAVLSPPKLEELYACQPAVNAVVTTEGEESVFALASRLRANHYDAALVFTHSGRTALPFLLAGVPRRVGYGERGRAWMLTDAIQPDFAIKIHRRPENEIKRLTHDYDAGLVGTPMTAPAMPVGFRLPPPFSRPPRPHIHHIHHYLRLASVLGASPEPVAPSLTVSLEDADTARQRFGLPAHDANCPLIGINPGAEYGLAKRWPEEKFIETARLLQARFPCRWVVLGGKTDMELSARIVLGIQNGDTVAPQTVWNVAGQTNLRELCAILSGCDVVLSNDTGPTHVAAAVGTPVVVPYGSTSPEITGPGLPGDSQHRLLKSAAPCAPCFHRVCPIEFRCMNGITGIGVTQVVDALASVYEQRNRAERN